MDRNEVTQRRRDLAQQGWGRRFTAEEPRLSEMKDLYESLGLEVLIEPVVFEDDRECAACFSVEGAERRYKTIYTRGKGVAGRESEDLFE